MCDPKPELGMNAKLDNALERLRRILPLHARQQQCSEPVQELHREFLRSFVARGRILSRQEVAQYVDDPDEAIQILRENDMVVCAADGTPVGAYPFTMEEREYRVRANGHLVHAMCALDALAVSPMFDMRTEIDSRCRVTGDPVHILQSGKIVENPWETGWLHIGIAWGAADVAVHCADSLCMEMTFLRDGAVAQKWLRDDKESREIFPLPEAVDFAARFFVPLMFREFSQSVPGTIV
jgi:hypothetical protein